MTCLRALTSLLGVARGLANSTLARYSALTPSLALKAHCAFNFEQAQRIDVTSRALCSSKSSIRTTLRLLRVDCCCGCSDLALILFLVEVCL
ncbi:hypothetical protein CJI53_02960 [Bifidobacteriaceae bacterium VN002]|nr:hypothetical protein CJI53_02960 [Bifidobacteriaceae bacterium VN002]